MDFRYILSSDFPPQRILAPNYLLCISESVRKKGSSRKTVHAVAVPAEGPGAPLKALLLFALFLLLGISYKLYFPVLSGVQPISPSTVPTPPRADTTAAPSAGQRAPSNPQPTAEEREFALSSDFFVKTVEWLSDPYREPTKMEKNAIKRYVRGLKDIPGNAGAPWVKVFEGPNAPVRDIFAVFAALPQSEFIEVMQHEIKKTSGIVQVCVKQMLLKFTPI